MTNTSTENGQNATEKIVVRPDAKGRITLGKLAEGISSYHISRDSNGRITLEPFAEIPAREKWLFDNKKAMKQVLRGVKDSAEGKASSRGSFSKYLEE